LLIVGREADLNQAAVFLGNSLKELNETHFIPLFIGIFSRRGDRDDAHCCSRTAATGPARPGGGPLIVALVLGRFGRIGRLVCHMPVNANIAFRDFGIALFFAAVGLDAGAKFFATVSVPPVSSGCWPARV